MGVGKICLLLSVLKEKKNDVKRKNKIQQQRHQLIHLYLLDGLFVIRVSGI